MMTSVWSLNNFGNDSILTDLLLSQNIAEHVNENKTLGSKREKFAKNKKNTSKERLSLLLFTV